MRSKPQLNKSILCSIALAAAVALVLLLGVVPAVGQSTIPPTAREAASLPQFAARLANPTTAHRSVPAPAAGTSKAGQCSLYPSTPQRPVSHPGNHRPLPQQGFFYANGPSNGLCDIQGCTVDAWTIDFGYTVTNSVGVGGGVASATFAFWLFPGDTVTSVDWSLGTTPFGSDIGHGTVSDGNVTEQYISSNQYGYDITAVTITGLYGGVKAGDWITLANATVPSGDPVYWDENNGPSAAQESAVGTIPSESFNISGGNQNWPCFEPEGNLQVIHDFTGKEDGGWQEGLTIDNVGNIYGTSADGGGNGYGVAYKLALKNQNWLLTPLYSYPGNYTFLEPNAPIIGPEGVLYGTARCSYGGCSLIYSLTPSPTACLTALCSWTESTLYRIPQFGFPPPTGLVFDQAGNLYGVLPESNVVFELTPSGGGGWTENTIYTFSGGSDGSGPSDLLLGKDGNFYGVTSDGGQYGDGTVFQLVPSGGGWAENLLYSFQNQSDGANPFFLIQDSSGNLFGLAYYGQQPYYPQGTVFMLSPSNGKWIFSTLLTTSGHDGESYTHLILDASGNMYVSGQGDDGGCAGYQQDIFSYIKKGVRGSDGWQWTTPVYYWDETFDAQGPLALDTQGNLYGTTQSCGKYNGGTVWQLSP